VLLDLLGFGMMLPLLPFYAQTLGASVVEIGILFGAFSFAQFFCAPAIGWLSDRFGRRPVLLVSIAGGLAAYLLMAVAPGLGRWGYAALLAARLGAGATAANFAVAPAYVADVLPPAERARGMGLLGAAFGLGFVLGPAIGGALGLWGHVAVPLGAAALAAVNLVLAAAWLPETLPGGGRGRAGGRIAAAAPRGAADRRAVGGLVVLFFLITFCFSLMESTLALFAQERFGFGQRQTSWLFVLIGLVLVAIQGGAVGRLSRRFGERRLALGGVALLALSLAALPEPARVPGFAGVACLLAAGIALANPPAMALLTRVAAVHSQGATMGISHAVGSLARIFGPLAGTWLFAHAGAAWPFRTGGALMAAALGFGFVAMRWVARVTGAGEGEGDGATGAAANASGMVEPTSPAGGAIEPR
jgi:MFS family permease